MTRQFDYQIRKLRLGLCVNCGKEKLVTATLGEKCRMKQKMKFAKWRLKKLKSK